MHERSRHYKPRHWRARSPALAALRNYSSAPALRLRWQQHQASNRRPHKSWHTERDLPKATGRKCEARKTSLVLFPASTAVLRSPWSKAPHLDRAPQPWHSSRGLLSCSGASGGAPLAHPHPASRSTVLFLQPAKSFCRARVCAEQTLCSNSLPFPCVCYLSHNS